MESRPVTEDDVVADRTIVLFDGVCNLCNGSVRFIIRRDRHDRFRFAPLQSEAGRALVAAHGLSGDLSTFYVLDNGEAFDRSAAWLQVFRRLGGAWRLMAGLGIVPRPVRDWVYTVIGRNRYTWFGRQDACPVPDPATTHKFLS